MSISAGGSVVQSRSGVVSKVFSLKATYIVEGQEADIDQNNDVPFLNYSTKKWSVH